MKNKISKYVDVVLTWYLRWAHFMGQTSLSKFLVNMCWLKMCFFVTFCLKPPKKWLKINCEGKWVGGFCVMMFGMLILGWKKAQRSCSTPVKKNLMLLSYFCLDWFLKFGEKWLFSYFYSIFKHNKRFLHNIMIFQIDL